MLPNRNDEYLRKANIPIDLQIVEDLLSSPPLLYIDGSGDGVDL